MAKDKKGRFVSKKAVESPVEKSPEKESKKIENISEDVISKLGPEIQKDGYRIKVRRLQKGMKGGFIHCVLGMIDSRDLGNKTFEELIDQRYGSGEFKIEVFDLNNKRILVPGIENCEIAIGDIENKEEYPNQTRPSFPRPVSQPMPFTPGDVRNDPDVQKRKANLEIKKLQLDEVELDRKLNMAQGVDNKNEALDLKLQLIQKEFTSQMEKLISSLKPQGSPEITALQQQIKDLSDTIKNLKSEKESQSWMQLMIETMKSSTAQQIEILKSQIQTQSETIKSVMEKQPDSKGLSLDGFAKMINLVRDLDGNRMVERDEEPRPGPWQSLIMEVANVLKQLSANGTLTKLLPGNPPPSEITPELINELADKIAPQLVADIKKNNPAPVATPQANPATPPVQPNPVPDNSATEDDRKRRLNEMFNLILKEIETRPNDCQWIAYALKELPADILNEIKTAADDFAVMAVINRYSTKYVDADTLNKLQAKIVDMANQIWLGGGIAALRAKLKETANA